MNFQAVHDDDILRTAKRLYMTATPRIYTERSKGQLAKKQIDVVDMNDQEIYGPQLHRLRFKTAVEAGMLSDYRVILLGVNQSQVTPGLRQRLEDIEAPNLKGKKKPGLAEMTRVLGLSLAINGITRGEGMERPERLVRTMAYSNTIARSKWFTAALGESQVKAATTKRLEEGRARPVEVIHLDASASALQRNEELRRLARAEEDRALRIICNVKLFTEGVDVPNLNAVAFMDPRDSQVDVVQAVGRVMRKAPDKTLGYIVIPVIVEPGQNVTDALEKSQEGYQTVGRVLRALQAHDERLLEDIARFVEVYEAERQATPGPRRRGGRPPGRARPRPGKPGNLRPRRRRLRARTPRAPRRRANRMGRQDVRQRLPERRNRGQLGQRSSGSPSTTRAAPRGSAPSPRSSSATRA